MNVKTLLAFHVVSDTLRQKNKSLNTYTIKIFNIWGNKISSNVGSHAFYTSEFFIKKRMTHFQTKGTSTFRQETN